MSLIILRFFFLLLVPPAPPRVACTSILEIFPKGKISGGNTFPPAIEGSGIAVLDVPIPISYVTIGNSFVYKKDMIFSEDAQKIMDSPNAGGSSIVSEAVSFEILKNDLGAISVKTEMEVSYWSDHWKRCDYITRINGENVAVSVTRVAYAPGKQLDREMALELYSKKLYGLVVARAGIMVDPIPANMSEWGPPFDNKEQSPDGYMKSILHILCRNQGEVDLLQNLYAELSEELKSDIGVIINVITGDTDWVFTNRKY